MSLQAPPVDAEPLRSPGDFDLAALLDQITQLAYARNGERLLTKAEVRTVTGLGDTELWRLLSEGAFPKPRLRSPTRLCWLQSEIDRWMHALPIATKLPSPNKAPAVSLDRACGGVTREV